MLNSASAFKTRRKLSRRKITPTHDIPLLRTSFRNCFVITQVTSPPVANGVLPPLPQLPSHLDQRLHLLRGRQPVVDHPAVFVGSLVETPDRIHIRVG